MVVALLEAGLNPMAMPVVALLVVALPVAALLEAGLNPMVMPVVALLVVALLVVALPVVYPTKKEVVPLWVVPLWEVPAINRHQSYHRPLRPLRVVQWQVMQWQVMQL